MLPVDFIKLQVLNYFQLSFFHKFCSQDHVIFLNTISLFTKKKNSEGKKLSYQNEKAK